MNFQSKGVNMMAEFSEGRFFKVLVIIGTVHYSWFDISNVYPIPFESRNAMFTQLIDQNDEKRCQLVDYSGISDTVQNESACDHHRGNIKIVLNPIDICSRICGNLLRNVWNFFFFFYPNFIAFVTIFHVI